MTASIHLFKCRTDNYGVLIHDPVTKATAAIDAPEAAAVEKALAETGWALSDILVTHHHADHTDGIKPLKEKYRCRVVAPAAEAGKIPAVDEAVSEGDVVKVGSLTARALETPGHTAGHVSYWFEADKLAFVADTIFSIGCGRVIEGTYPMMWNSIAKLRALPDDTRLYCGHEYTLANIKFARTVEPNNAALKARAIQAEEQVKAGRPTIPTTIREEKAANPFLRADVPEVAALLGMSGKSPADVFGEIRERKNKF
jgi:hydroxyacylglutathione hydrolase